MKKSEKEESLEYLNRVFQNENDLDVKRFILQCKKSLPDEDLVIKDKFKLKLDDLIHNFKKQNNKYPIAHFENNEFNNMKILELEKTRFQKVEKIEPTSKKFINVTINSYDQLIDAMKCILWSLENEPSTIKKIFQHIFIEKNGEVILIPEEDYEITNKIISKATRDNQFYLQKTSINGKLVFLYSNTSKKRIGYYLDGKLRTLRDISKFYDIAFTTLHSRLKKMNIDQAVKK